LTDDLVRYQRGVVNLYNAGLIPSQSARRRIYMEIGGGYGGLAHQIGRAIGNAGVYIDVDLSQMLFWAAVFLRLNNPDKRIYLFDRASFDPSRLETILAENDFVLLPNYLLGELQTFPEIDAVINMLSFQEMKEEQIRAYCAFMSKHLRGWFYSDNFSRHPYNKELNVDLYDIYTAYFTVLPSLNMRLHPPLKEALWRLYPYLATPKERPAELRPQVRLLKGEDYNVGY
jgi:hypothetical protein